MADKEENKAGSGASPTQVQDPPLPEAVPAAA